MIINFKREHSLRGHVFEYAARIILRRERKNNFIFLTSRFDSINEIIDKYRIIIPKEKKDLVELFRNEWRRCDLIEFVLSDKQKRELKRVIIYEVKTKIDSVDRNYFEFCTSGIKFFNKWCLKGQEANIISIIIFDRWRWSFNIIPFEKVKIREYSNFKKQISI